MGDPTDDILTGQAGNDTLQGLSGADTLDGGAGTDQVQGGDGDDVILQDGGASGSESLDGGAGTDTLRISSSTNTGATNPQGQPVNPAPMFPAVFNSIERVEFDSVSGRNLQMTLGLGQVGPGKLDASATLVGGAGTDTLIVVANGAGQYFMPSFEVSNWTTNLSAASDSLILLGGADTQVGQSFNYVLHTAETHDGIQQALGASGHDILFGGEGVEFLGGGGGNDTLDAGAGDDSLTGAAGNDVFVLAGGGDVITDFTVGQDKFDVSDFGFDSLASIQPYLSTVGSDTVLTIVFNGVANTTTFRNLATGNLTADEFIFASDALTQTGTANADLVMGGGGGDLLTGDAGNDTVSALGGADTLGGGAGTDKVQGGDGDDVILQDGGASGFETLDGGAGTDTLRVSSSTDLGTTNPAGQPINPAPMFSAQFFSIERLAFDSVAGRALQVSLSLGQVGPSNFSPNATIIGGAGTDTLTVVANGGGQVFMPNFSVNNWTTNLDGTPSDVIVLVGADSQSGQVFDYVLHAAGTHSGIQVLSAGGGNDILLGGDNLEGLTGGAGNDTLDGGDGNDTLTGGAGNDVFVLTSGNEVINDFAVGQDKFDVSDFGFDSLASMLPYLSTVGSDTVLTITFNGVVNTTTLKNVAIGTLSDGDFLFATDAVTQTGTANADLVMGGAAGDSVSGLSGGDTVSGLGGEDTLDGGVGTDKVLGGDGNDVLLQDGGASGAETLDGGAGTDTLRISSSASGGTGAGGLPLNPAFITPATLTLIERLEFASVSGRVLQVQVGLGQIGAGKLDPNAVVVGGAGVDTLQVMAFGGGEYAMPSFTLSNWTTTSDGTPSDILILVGADGASGQVFNYVLHTAETHSGIQIISAGGGNDILLGGDDIDGLIGGAGTDTLDGGPGNDTLTGGAGNDVFVLSAGQEVITDFTVGQDRFDVSDFGFDSFASLQPYLSTVGSDTVLSIVYDGATHTTTFRNVGLGTLTANEFVFAAGGGATQTGTANADLLVGGSGADRLNSLAGGDTLTGLGGADTLGGGVGTDKVQGGDGDDVILQDGGASGFETLDGGAGTDTLRVSSSTDLGTTNPAGQPINPAPMFSAQFFSIERLAFDSVAGRALQVSLSLGQVGPSNFSPNATVIGGAGTDTLTVVANGGGQVFMPNFSVNNWTTNLDSTPSDVIVLVGADSQSGQVFDYVLHAAGTHSGIQVLSAGGGNDILLGGDNLEGLTGGAGNDTLDGGDGNDTLTGGAGNDVFVLSRGSEVINDFAVGQDKFDLSDFGFDGLEGVQPFLSTVGSDTVLTIVFEGVTHTTTFKNVAIGTLTADEFIFAATGPSTQVGTGNADVLVGGGAEDRLSGGSGNDTLNGMSGADTLAGEAGTDQLSGGDGNDVLLQDGGANGTETLDGGAGTDTLRVSSSASGGTGAGGLPLNPAFITPATLTSIERLEFASVSGRVLQVQVGLGQIGAGKLDPNAVVVGGAGVDTLQVMAFGGGEYAMPSFTLSNWTTTSDGTPSDILILVGADGASGQVFNYVLHTAETHSGIQIISAGGGNDILLGGDDIDGLIGGAGTDTLDGGPGNDTLTGGAGNDVFVLSAGQEVITDFTVGQDRFDVSDFGFDSFASLQPYLSTVGSDTVLSITYNGVLQTTTFKGVAFAAFNANSFIFATAGPATQGGTSNADLLIGGSGDDSLNGLGGGDTLQGLGGSDTLDGGAGADQLRGGDGNDLLLQDGGASGAETLDGGAGTDTLRVSSSTNTGTTNPAGLPINPAPMFSATFNSIERVEFDSVAGRNLQVVVGLGQVGPGKLAANATLVGGAGADGLIVSITGGGDFTMPSFSLSNWTTALDGSSSDLVALVGTDSQSGQTFNYTLRATESHGGIQGLTAGGGNDVLLGGDDMEFMLGGGGDDTLDGGAGNDTQNGGGGNDIFVLRAGQDVITDFTVGQDRFELTTYGFDSFASLQPYLSTVGSDTVLSITYDGVVNTTTFKGVAIGSLSGANFVFPTGPLNDTATSNADLVMGSAAGDLLNGGSGNDTVSGLAGADTLAGGFGTDQVLGGDGNDVIVHDSSASGAETLDGGAGTDTLRVSSSTSGGTNPSGQPINPASLVAAALGSLERVEFASVAGRNLQIEVAYGQLGGGQLATTATLVGGAGTDTLQVTANGGGDFALPSFSLSNWSTPATGPVDAVILQGADGPSAQVFDYILRAAQTHDGVQLLVAGGGNDLLLGGDNIEGLVGGAGDDTLDGGAGNDTLNGAPGADVLRGGDGADSLGGGGGADTLDGGTGTDQLIAGDGNDLLLLDGSVSGVEGFDGGLDTDTLRISSSASGGTSPTGLPINPASLIGATLANLEKLELASVAGRVLQVQLGYGQIGAGKLAPGATVTGGAGVDTLQVIANGGGDFSLPAFTLANWTTPTNGDPADLLALVGVDGPSGQTFNYTLRAASTHDGIQVLSAGGGNDLLLGGGSVEVLVGGTGADTLDAASGADTLDGGVGADVLRGGDGADSLTGGEGADTLTGGSGTDNVVGGDGNDVLAQDAPVSGAETLDGGQGVDTLRMSSTVAGGTSATGLPINNASLIGATLSSIERMEFASQSGRILQVQIAYSQVASGQFAPDALLVGGAGVDSLQVIATGGGDFSLPAFNVGNWTNPAGVAADNVTLLALDGQSGATFDYTLHAAQAHAGVQILSAGGGSDSLTGGGSQEALFGGGGDDTLDGGGGADSLTGGAGGDRINGGDGEDLATFSGTRADYRVHADAGGTVTVTDLRSGSPDGVDIIAGVERFRFLDSEHTAADLGQNLSVGTLGSEFRVNTATNSGQYFGVGSPGTELEFAL